ncbi:serine hydrolase domain-containing protein [Clostridium sp. C105KSO13]|uniref:serine hydrolase domain-containing protein n=1 Tax=Clostridium sp. C105KSO13 TaxID=1776045 RepID=UPI0007408A59|nr:serine hydrolase domain-containing protein [Clostridium sp. C105KSO13]CUX35225.1 Esterase EstB [Clostridium sp. C105KSO13]
MSFKTMESMEEETKVEERVKQDLDKRITEEIRKGHIPGVLGGACVDGKETDYFSYGKANISTGMELRRNTIFRLFSMSKPVCAVAAWILIERGDLDLEDPVGKYLPEYKKMNCLKAGHIVPAKESVQIHHLLNMTAGLAYNDEDTIGQETEKIFAQIHRAIEAGEMMRTREVVKNLAEVPLSFDPGEQWRYGLCADVLGAVIEVVSGSSLGDFYQKEIFMPLGMSDTGFYVPKEKQNRFAPLYKRIPSDSGDNSALICDSEYHLGLGGFLSKPAFESAGAGLVSTYQDYMGFAQMLANGGVFDHTRILSPDTVKQFTRNQLTAKQTESIYFQHMKGYGYGNLMRVYLDKEEALVPGSENSFGWDGWCGPYMAVNMEQKKSIVFFIQVSAYADWDLNVQIIEALL